MTDVAEHTTAVLERLDAHAHMSLLLSDNKITIYDGPRKPGDALRVPPLVTVYVYVSEDERTKLNQDITDETWLEIVTHSGGQDRIGADTVRNKVTQQLLDWVPVVDDFWCSSVYHVQGNPPDWDTTTGDAIIDAIDFWRYRTKPA